MWMNLVHNFLKEIAKLQCKVQRNCMIFTAWYWINVWATLDSICNIYAVYFRTINNDDDDDDDDDGNIFFPKKEYTFP